MIKFILIPGIFLTVTAIHAQNTWQRKAYLGGKGRQSAVGFSIGDRGYIGTGMDGASYSMGDFIFSHAKDFWEFDPVGNVWTQKADFAGTARSGAVGFSIGNKGYIGTGHDSNKYKKDFWEWDQATNTWSKKADFGGEVRTDAVGFSIGDKGYIGTGSNLGSSFKDFWEWDQLTDTWTKRSDFGGSPREVAVGFSIGNKGYIGTGGAMKDEQDFWEWDQATDTWKQMANFKGGGRDYAVGFSIGNKGYIGTGNFQASVTSSTYKQDFWEWDQSKNTWSKKMSFGGGARQQAVGFSIGNKGYIGTGRTNDSNYTKDIWEYIPK